MKPTDQALLTQIYGRLLTFGACVLTEEASMSHQAQRSLKRVAAHGKNSVCLSHSLVSGSEVYFKQPHKARLIEQDFGDARLI